MLTKALALSYLRFSTLATRNLIPIKVNIQGKVYTYMLVEGWSLGQQLRKIGAPLLFFCDLKGTCATCAIKLSYDDYTALEETHQISQGERVCLAATGVDDLSRMSCKIVVNSSLTDLTFIVDKTQ